MTTTLVLLLWIGGAVEARTKNGWSIFDSLSWPWTFGAYMAGKLKDREP
jgi:hypothetical protein